MTTIVAPGGAVPTGADVHLSFDNAGSLGNDDSGNGNNGSLIGNVAYDAGGRLNGAAAFDGADDAVSLGDLNFMDTGSSGTFTAALWFNRDTDVGVNTNHNVANVLFAQSSNSANDNVELGTIGNQIELYLDTGGGGEDTTRNAAAGIANGSWTHVALVYDQNQANEALIYVNGGPGQGGQVITYNQWAGPLDNSNGSPFSLGLARPDGNNWGDFDGLLDEFYLYQRPLSAVEVENLYSSVLPSAVNLPDTHVESTADSTLLFDTTLPATIGNLTVAGGTTLNLNGAPSYTVGDVTAGDLSSIVLDGGSGDLIITGILSPGDSPGTVDIDGNLTMSPTSQFDWELGPMATDEVVVTGDLLLDWLGIESD